MLDFMIKSMVSVGWGGKISIILPVGILTISEVLDREEWKLGG